MNDQQLLEDVLADEGVCTLLKDLGFEQDTPEGKTEVIGIIGDTIMERVLLDVLKKLPEDAREGFEKNLNSGDMESVYTYLAPHIPDVNQFITTSIKNELTAIRAELPGVMSRA